MAEANAGDPDVLHVRSRRSGEQWTFRPGRDVVLRRSPDADVPLTHPRVSRSGHARLRHEDGAWVLLADDRAGGVFVNGVPSSRVALGGRTVVRLGSALEGEDLEFSLPAAHPRLPAAAPLVLAADDPTSTAPLTEPAPDWTLRVQVDDGPARAFPPVGPVRVGRGADNDVTIAAPSVSRRHGYLTPARHGWSYVDTSQHGTWAGGARVRGARAVHGAVELRLGDRVNGPRLRLDPVVPASVQRLARLRRRAVAAATAGVVALGALTVAAVLSRTGPFPASSLTGAALEDAKRSTVRLTMMLPDHARAGWGSGTIITADGLILTNAHVAAPDALGQVTLYPQQGVDNANTHLDYLLVSVRGAGDAAPLRDAYRARPVITDGYLDLSVVRIYATAGGGRVDPSRLHLMVRPLGSSTAMHAGDAITELGFPAASESRAATVTGGDLSAFVPDTFLHSGRAWLETTALTRSGNSGGSALNSAGELIGVPTQGRFGDEPTSRIRPVEWAKPLIAKARAAGDPGYRTPYVPDNSRITVAPFGWSAQENAQADPSLCGHVGGLMSVPAGTRQATFAFSVASVRAGGVVVASLVHGSTLVDTEAWRAPTDVAGGQPVCVALSFQPPEDGTYQVLFYTDPAPAPLPPRGWLNVGSSGPSTTPDSASWR